MNPMNTSSNRRTRLAAPLISTFVLSACAFSPVQPGMTRDEVTARLGTPSRIAALSPGTRLQYSGQPAGQWATMVDLDASGHVVRARQVLNANDFNRIEVGKWTRQDVELEFGPPANVGRVASWPHDIMTYRWFEIDNMLYWVYLDQNNVVQRTGQGIEFFHRNLKD
jgi:hypothetical protein